MRLSVVANGGDRLRPWLLAIISFGMVGSTIELLLLQHYEEPLQLAPIGLMAITLVVIGLHARRPTRTSVQVLKSLMATMVVVGAIGIVLHFRGNLEFQLEIDATQSGWSLVKKILRAKAPPALAPGSMAQLGLLGLLYTYRHPALSRRAGEPGR